MPTIRTRVRRHTICKSRLNSLVYQRHLPKYLNPVWYGDYDPELCRIPFPYIDYPPGFDLHSPYYHKEKFDYPKEYGFEDVLMGVGYLDLVQALQRRIPNGSLGLRGLGQSRRVSKLLSTGQSTTLGGRGRSGNMQRLEWLANVQL